MVLLKNDLLEREIMGETTVNGLSNLCDSDCIIENVNTVEEVLEVSIVDDILENKNNTLVENENNSQVFTKSPKIKLFIKFLKLYFKFYISNF